MELFDTLIDTGPFNILCRPFDLIYTRMQSSFFLHKRQKLVNPNLGPLETAKGILKNEGYKGFFKGFACKILRNIISVGSLFGAGFIGVLQNPQILQFYLIFTSVFTYPFRHTQLHLMNNNGPEMRSITSQFKSTYEIGGLTEFYRGFFQQAFHYQVLIPFWMRWTGYVWNDQKNNPMLRYLCLFVNSSLFVTTKHISGTVWKNYVMESASSHRSRTSFHCYMRMKDLGGPQALMRGISMQIIPLTMIFAFMANSHIGSHMLSNQNDQNQTTQ